MTCYGQDTLSELLSFDQNSQSAELGVKNLNGCTAHWYLIGNDSSHPVRENTQFISLLQLDPTSSDLLSTTANSLASSDLISTTTTYPLPTITIRMSSTPTPLTQDNSGTIDGNITVGIIAGTALTAIGVVVTVGIILMVCIYKQR